MCVDLVQDRERLAPVALAAEQPVAQLVVDPSAALPALLQPGRDPLLELGGGKAVEGAGIDRHPLAGEGIMRLSAFLVSQGDLLLARLIIFRRLHYRADRQAESA